MPQPSTLLGGLALAAALAVPAQARDQAGARIIMEHAGGRSEMLLQDTRARVSPSRGDIYMLLDADSGQRVLVNTRQQRVVEMPARNPGGSAPEVEVELRREGPGPEVAGYPTVRYVVRTGGQRCGSVLASKEALADAGSQGTARIFRMFSGEGRSGPNFTPDPCQRAFDALPRHFGEIGLPLRTRLPEGGASRVIRLETGVRFEPGTFSAPEDYERRSLKAVDGGE